MLIIKDFILDDMAAADTRRVDVPSPSAGIVGRVDAGNGVVDILEARSERLIARIRHLGPIAVSRGDAVAYGQSLGTQNNIGLPASAGRQVHLEMDTREYQQLDHYIRDLVDGRLPVQAEHRLGVPPRAVLDDGVQRVGERGARVAAVQQALVAGGFRGVGDTPIEVDGVYRLSMQGAVLAFQHAHGVAQSGDIDAATWRAALDLTLGKPILPPPVIEGTSRPTLPRAFDALFDQIRGHVGALDAERGRPFDAGSERMTYALLSLAAERRLLSVDQVAFSVATPSRDAASRVFLVQGRPGDPAHQRASMATVEAIATPVHGSLTRLQAMDPHRSAAVEPHLRHVQGTGVAGMSREI
ncbi:MAG TPA: peptidoglycan-binding domain-containing protein [Luteimonas sp.]|nr:peptidoglycan-binding domain-containing protein [Luteimonas sp.]